MISHVIWEKINISRKEVELRDTTIGCLAFGEISLTLEELSEVETDARIGW